MNRIKGAVESRPTGASRASAPGACPFPAFYDAQGNPSSTRDIVRNVAALIEKHGSNVWFEKRAPNCGRS